MHNHFILKDLTKLSEIVEETDFKHEEMPRLTISQNQDQFDTLIGLLKRQDASTQNCWELIRMLATNQNMYNKVLNIKLSDDKAKENEFWAKFFESGSVQKRSYQYEIVEALMEENQALTNRVFFVHF